MGAVDVPDWHAADGMYHAHVTVYRRICSRYTLDLPNRRRDLMADGLTDNMVHGALFRLREREHITEADTVWPTETGQYLAAYRLGWDAPREAVHIQTREERTA